MHLDANHLPVQADGDANDQLQRCAMIAFGQELSPVQTGFMGLAIDCMTAIVSSLQPKLGLYVRYPGASTSNCSGDQIISALSLDVLIKHRGNALATFARCLARLGFAQNYRDGLGSTKLQVPDFMLLRALPLFMRISPLLYPLAVIADLYLIVLAVGAILYARRSPDNVDHNVTIMTFAVCQERMPTPISYLARKLFKRFMPTNFGVTKLGASNAVQGALAWYHRAESGGNPEIADIYKPIVERM